MFHVKILTWWGQCQEFFYFIWLMNSSDHFEFLIFPSITNCCRFLPILALVLHGRVQEAHMNQISRAAGIAFILIFLSTGLCLAGSASLMGMSNNRQDNMNQVDLVFDRIPEIHVSRSGQRVRVVMENTRFSDSVGRIAGNDLTPPLIRVKLNSEGTKSIVDFYFRQIPQSVDITRDKGSARLTLNVFWDRQQAGSRPAIQDQRVGRLQPIRHGAAARKMVSSDYTGRWSDFFAQFEWPPQWDLPAKFSLPRFPGPLVMENRAFLPDALVELVNGGMWQAVENKTTELIDGDIGGRQAEFYQLLLAESLIRQNRNQKALSVLENMAPGTQRPQIQAWQIYFQVHATAGMGEYYRAARIAETQRKTVLQETSAAGWFAILKAEMDMAMGEPEQALGGLTQDLVYSGAAGCIASLRRGDVLYDIGDMEAASDSYDQVVSDLHLVQQYPGSLARYTSLLYRNQQYDTAYRHWFLLSEILAKRAPAHKPLADYWAAMARLHSGEVTRARLKLWEIEETAGDSEAGLRARLKLMDLDVVEQQHPDYDALLPRYDGIIEAGGKRQIREEAFFKQILACHLGGNNLAAVRQLGRFFDDYWAGKLVPEAQALFVEIFPGAVATMVEQKAYFEALTLVSKHRDLLAQAPITYGFLYDLAESYTRAGLIDQAATTYRYLMDLETDAQKRARIYLPLIQACDQQGSHEQVMDLAADYLNRFSGGAERRDVFYYYVRALAQTGQSREAARMLGETKRPAHLKTDLLAGNLFFEQKRYRLAAFYLGRAAAMAGQKPLPEADLKRAEAHFLQKKWQQAAPIYASLLDTDLYRGQAAFRLIRTYLNMGSREKALKLYRQMSEMEIEDSWLALSAQAMEIENRIN